MISYRKQYLTTYGRDRKYFDAVSGVSTDELAACPVGMSSVANDTRTIVNCEFFTSRSVFLAKLDFVFSF